MTLVIKRIYEDASASDGYRVLVDRLWPRGVSKDKAKLDLWLKEIAPSDGLRKWFNHEPAKFADFASRYQKELAENSAFVQLKELASQHKTVTLVYSAKDERHNQAVVIEQFMSK